MVGVLYVCIVGLKVRVDDYLYCSSCGYCLEGLGEREICVECGASLKDGRVVDGRYGF